MIINVGECYILNSIAVISLSITYIICRIIGIRFREKWMVVSLQQPKLGHSGKEILSSFFGPPIFMAGIAAFQGTGVSRIGGGIVYSNREPLATFILGILGIMFILGGLGLTLILLTIIWEGPLHFIKKIDWFIGRWI